MTKYEFIGALREKLRGLPEQEIGDRLNFYGEMIEDLMEEGLSEEEAVARIGTADEVAERIKSETTLDAVSVTERGEKQKKSGKPKEKRPLKAIEIVLLVLGFPLWFPVSLVAVVAVITLAIGISAGFFSICAGLWAVVITLWVAFGALVACAVGFLAAFPILAIAGKWLLGLTFLGNAMVSAGVAIFLFFGCKLLTKGVCFLVMLPFRLKKRRENVA